MKNDRIKIKVDIDGYVIRYEQSEGFSEWNVFGRDEDLYTISSDVDICRDLAERMQNHLNGNKPINS